jgi:site-specific recombinase XerD
MKTTNKISNFKYTHIPAIQDYVDFLLLDKSENTIISYISSIDRFFNWKNITSSQDIIALTSMDCRQYQGFLKGCGLSPNANNSHIRNLRALFNWMKENDYIDNSPFSKVKELKVPSKMKHYLSEDEISTILAHSKNIEEKTIFAFLISTGLRREELASLRLSNRKGNAILVTSTKGDKERYVFLPDDVHALFEEYLQWRNKKYGNEIDYIFVSKMRRKYSGEAIRLKFKTLMGKAGFSEDRIADLHPHSLRHTFLANFLGAGNDIKAGQIAMGHSNMKTTSDIYAHLRDNAMEAAFRNQKPIVNK